MSLIITSNTQQEFSERRNDIIINPGAPIQDPYSYHNALSNTITIPANSEVAVISTSINRGTLTNIGLGEVRWHLFFGQALTQNSVATYSMSQITSDTIPVSLNIGTYSPAEILPALNTAIARSINHPKLWEKDGSGMAGVGAGRVRHATSTFFPVPNPLGGYTFGMFQNNRTGLANLNANTFVPIITGPSIADGGPGAIGMVYAGGGAGGTITRTAVNNAVPDYQWDYSAMCVLSELPIATGGSDNWAPPLNPTPLVPAVANVGTMVIDITQAEPAPIDIAGNPQPGMGGWSIGLTRPQLQDQVVDGEEYRFQGPGYATQAVITNFCDYELRYEQDYVTGNGVLRLLHWVWNTAMNSMMPTEITYWGDDLVAINATYRTTAQGQITGDADFGYEIQAGGGPGVGRLAEVHWEVWNEEMRIWLSDLNNANPVTIMDTTSYREQTSTGAVASRPGAGIQALGLTRCFKPTNENTRALYPRFNLSLNGAFFVMDQFYSDITWAKRNGQTGGWDYPNTTDANPGEWTGGQTIWGQSLVAEPGQNTLKVIDSRANVSRPDISGYSYQTMAAPTVGGPTAPLLQSLNMDFGIIINTSAPDDSSTTLGAYMGAFMATMPVTPMARSILGYSVGNWNGNIFSNSVPEIGRLYDYDYTTAVPAIVLSPFNDRSRFIVQSTNVPGVTRKTCFVKCSSLTHQSYNFAKELPSKILWHIPKYDNQGNATGALFFENPSPVYLDLKNPAPLVINDLHIEIVDKNELHATDLTGTTIVTLHIRDSRR